MKVFIADVLDADRIALEKMIAEIAGVELTGSFKDAYHTIEAFLAHLVRNSAPDLMIIDMDLAAGSGVGVLRFVKNKLPGIKIIMLCTCGSNKCIDECSDNGADFFLYKATDISAVRKIISELLPVTSMAKADFLSKESMPECSSPSR